jgi:hypothetical protein
MALLGERFFDRSSRAGVLGKRHHRIGNVSRVLATTGMSDSRFGLGTSLPPRRSLRCGSRLRDKARMVARAAMTLCDPMDVWLAIHAAGD